MGIIVSDALTLENGIEVSGYYVHIDDILLQKSNVGDFKYTVTGEARYFATKQARDQCKSKIDTYKLVLATSNVSDIHEQLYTELKNKFESYEDVFEIEPTEETSNATPTEETSNATPTEETSNAAPTEETSNATPVEETSTSS